MEKIEVNLETLSNYPVTKALRVFYKNMDYFLTAEEIQSAYLKHVGEISKVVPTIGQDGKKRADGYFVMPNRDQAKKLV